MQGMAFNVYESIANNRKRGKRGESIRELRTLEQFEALVRIQRRSRPHGKGESDMGTKLRSGGLIEKEAWTPTARGLEELEAFRARTPETLLAEDCR